MNGSQGFEFWCLAHNFEITIQQRSDQNLKKDFCIQFEKLKKTKRLIFFRFFF